MFSTLFAKVKSDVIHFIQSYQSHTNTIWTDGQLTRIHFQCSFYLLQTKLQQPKERMDLKENSKNGLQKDHETTLFFLCFLHNRCDVFWNFSEARHRFLERRSPVTEFGGVNLYYKEFKSDLQRFKDFLQIHFGLFVLLAFTNSF